MKSIAINWFASTGSFHRNGRTIFFAKTVPAQNDTACAALAKKDAEKFAAEVGQPLKEFSVQLIGFYHRKTR